MIEQTNNSSRRGFLKNAGTVAAAGTLLTTSMRSVHAAGSSEIKVVLIGCGGRGTGAASQALSVPDEQIKLVGMVDVFPERLRSSYTGLKEQFADKVDVPEDRQFIGFDGYKEAMDLLSPGDVVIMATPPAFRWVQFTYAIEKGLNVFMEKPVTVDGPTSKRMLELGQRSVEKNLKVGVGLMCRHCEARHDLVKRIRDGEIGDIIMLRAYRMAGPTASAASKPKPEGISELSYQIQRFHSFLWASGGAYSDFLIHNIDECCWIKDAWPVEAIASGGRHYRGEDIDQNFDSYSVEYTFEDGTKLLLNGRTMPGCKNEFASYAHGSKSCATISASGHSPANCKIYTGQKFSSRQVKWEYGQDEKNPYQLEWNNLIHAIRNDLPYNEVERGVMASAVTAMGRMAAHTGQLVTMDDLMECDHEFAPNVDRLRIDGPAPLQADENGKYPVPMPGIITNREYA